MSFDKNPGSAKLAEALVGRIRKENESPQVLDFGTITSDGGLQTDTFKAVIPKGSYTVLRHLKLGKKGDELTVTKEMEQGAVGGGENTGEMQEVLPHEHSIPVPECMRSIQPGDRVLVAWVQNEAVVIDIIMAG